MNRHTANHHGLDPVWRNHVATGLARPAACGIALVGMATRSIAMSMGRRRADPRSSSMGASGPDGSVRDPAVRDMMLWNFSFNTATAPSWADLEAKYQTMKSCIARYPRAT